jgi:hypothetical protein
MSVRALRWAEVAHEDFRISMRGEHIVVALRVLVLGQ